MKRVIKLKVKVKTEKEISKIKHAIERGIYIGLDSPTYGYVAQPKDVKVIFKE